LLRSAQLADLIVAGLITVDDGQIEIIEKVKRPIFPACWKYRIQSRDPRNALGRQYLIGFILVVAVAAALAGARNYSEIANLPVEGDFPFTSAALPGVLGIIAEKRVTLSLSAVHAPRINTVWRTAIPRRSCPSRRWQSRRGRS
jgi:hypothetical protein